MVNVRYSFEQIYGIVNGWANPYSFCLFDRFPLYSNYLPPYIVESTGQITPAGTSDRSRSSSMRCDSSISLPGIRLFTGLLSEVSEAEWNGPLRQSSPDGSTSMNPIPFIDLEPDWC
jgi:hypothetical protein